MNRRAHGIWPRITLIVLTVATAAVAADEQSTEGKNIRWMVIQPGYPGSTEDAAGFMKSFSDYLQKTTGLAGVRGTYYNLPREALGAIEAERPAFSLVSLGFYLEHRRRLNLVPLVESHPQDRFVIVALEGAVDRPEALRGRAVAGGPLYEKTYLERVVFRGKAPVASWKGEPVLRPSRALRRLERGQYKAVVLTGREYAALGGLSRRKKLEKVLESAYYPQTLLVHLKSRPAGEEKASKVSKDRRAKRSTTSRIKDSGREAVRSRTDSGAARELSEAERLALKRAFLALPEHPEGRALLKTMGARGFNEVLSEWLKRTEGIYDAEEEK